MKKKLLISFLKINIFFIFLIFKIINFLTMKTFSRNLENFFCKIIIKILDKKKYYFTATDNSNINE